MRKTSRGGGAVATRRARNGRLGSALAGALLCVLALPGCGSRGTGLMLPVAAEAPGATRESILVATTRRPTPQDQGTLFSGERGRGLSFTRIGVSLPPAHQVGEIEWPPEFPGDPARHFVTTDVAALERESFSRAIGEAARRHGGRVLLFVHGYNNKFDEAVYRFAQIRHDSGAPAAAVLFTWPSRGELLAYPYDRESAAFSRDGLEMVLQVLAENPAVRDVSILAHSMGNYVALEALRQYAIRRDRLPPKFTQAMLASPDVDVDVARTQIEALGERRPHFTLFTSQDDRALQVSRTVWGSTARLGAVNPDAEPYRTALERYRIDVVDLTTVSSPDRLHHGKFAQAPEIVRSIGQRLASGQTIGTRREGLGDQVGGLVAGAAATVGNAAGLVVSAPIAIVDPRTRENFAERTRTLIPGTPDAGDIAPVDGPITPSRTLSRQP